MRATGGPAVRSFEPAGVEPGAEAATGLPVGVAALGERCEGEPAPAARRSRQLERAGP
nr:hypothetical protein StreXyl84_07480 [Streptomyces sp. Xyl84]